MLLHLMRLHVLSVLVTATKTLPSTESDRDRWTPQLWGVLIVLCVVLLLDGLDVSMVGVALPSIGADLGMSATALQWVVNGYVLGFGGLLLFGGRMADLLGRRRVFLVALAVFAVASLIGGLVDNGVLLIASRFVKGVAAAFTAPTAMSILTTTFAEGRSRNRALSIFAVFGASGYSSGLILGGLLTSLGWRWTFLAPVPIAAAVLVAAILLVPRDRGVQTGGYDIPGALTLTGGMLLAVYTVVTAPENGWTQPLTVGSLILAAALLSAFVAIERRAAHPLIRLGILRVGSIVRANIALAVLFGSYLSFQFMMALYMQSVLSWPPLGMALALLPAGLIVAVGSPFVGRLINQFGSAPLIAASMSSMALGYLYFLLAGGEGAPNYAAQILPSVLLFGVGFALGFSSIMSQATGGVDDSEQGLASGLVQTSGQVGAALVLAAVTALVAAGSHSMEGAQAMSFADFRPGLALVAAVALAGAAAAASPLLRRRAAVSANEAGR